MSGVSGRRRKELQTTYLCEDVCIPSDIEVEGQEELLLWKTPNKKPY
jgi:hypothetical protein